MFVCFKWPTLMTEVLAYAKVLLLSVGRLFRTIDPCSLVMSHSDSVVVAICTVPWLLLMLAAANALA